jgi:hypothetical protein
MSGTIEMLPRSGGVGWCLTMARGGFPILSVQRRGFADREKKGLPFRSRRDNFATPSESRIEQSASEGCCAGVDRVRETGQKSGKEGLDDVLSSK